MAANAVVVTADLSLRETISKAAHSVAGCRLFIAENAAVASQLLDAVSPSIVFFHLSATPSEAELIGLLQKITASRKSTAVVAIGDEYCPAQALDLLRKGVADYISRPLSINRLAWLTDVLTVRSRYDAGTASQATTATESCPRLGSKEPFYFCAGPMAEMVAQVEAVSVLDSTILLTGETGTGKTHLTRLIHEKSNRSSKPYVVVNCGALVPSLLESELFGHVKGAFTGADQDRPGKFLTAADGTLVLDEIDSLAASTQARLLRAVDESVFEPVGGDTPRRLRARIVAASNLCLEDEVAAGRFRSDLFYRINVISFHIPPLRERKRLIPDLVDRFLVEFFAGRDVPAPRLSRGAQDALEAYDWPGNIRELRNVIERTVAFCNGPEIEVSDLPDAVTDFSEPKTSQTEQLRHAAGLLHARANTEVQLIIDTLSRNDDNRSRTAQDLGISRVTLYKKLHKYGLI